MNWYSRPTGVQVLDVVFAQTDGQRANIFMEALDTARPEQRNDPRLLCEEPSQRDLGGRRPSSVAGFA